MTEQSMVKPSLFLTKTFERVISGLDFVISLYIVCMYNKNFLACDQ